MDSKKPEDTQISTKMEHMVVSDKAFDRLSKTLEESADKPSPSLVNLLRREKRWVE